MFSFVNDKLCHILAWLIIGKINIVLSVSSKGMGRPAPK